MGKNFRSLYQQLVARQISTGQFLNELKSVGDFSDDLLSVMQERITAQDWPGLNSIIHAIFLIPPDRRFTELLCGLLDNHRYDGYMEAVADALIDISDERSVPCIIRTLDYYVYGDDDFHFNRKLIVALYKIGTQESIEGINLALNSPKELIRKEAKEALKGSSAWKET